jgi:hypothetical protein
MLSVETAWGCFTTNLGMPGFGSIYAGRRIAGVLQAALGFTGLFLTLVFGTRFVAWYIGNWSALTEGVDPIGTLSASWLQVRWALLGMALFLIAILWSLLTGLAVVREAKRAAKSQVPPVI